MSVVRVHKACDAVCPLLGPSLFVWVQGCPRRCPGCFNEGTLDADGPCREMNPGELADLWETRRGGLVLSGGEPFWQASALAQVCAQIRQREPETAILAYTGFRLDELLSAREEGALALLGEIDVLVDGPFLINRLTDHALAGSDNQRIFLLGDRISPERVAGLALPGVQVTLTPDSRVQMLGTGSSRIDMNGLVERIQARGLSLEAIHD